MGFIYFILFFSIWDSYVKKIGFTFRSFSALAKENSVTIVWQLGNLCPLFSQASSYDTVSLYVVSTFVIIDLDAGVSGHF